MSCPVCYTDDADMVVCWNEHGLCETCYRECLKPRVRRDEIAGVDKYHVNDKCPTCREPMFDWYDLVVENMNNTMIPPVRRRRQGRGRRCAICLEYGHNGRTCPTRQERQRQERQRQERQRQEQERQRQQRQVDNHNERAISIRMRTLEERIRTILTDLQANVRDPLSQTQPQPQQPQPQQPVRQRSAPRCSICRNTGHNRRTCPTIRT